MLNGNCPIGHCGPHYRNASLYSRTRPIEAAWGKLEDAQWLTSGYTKWHYVKQERIVKLDNVLKGMFYSHFW